MSAAAPYDPRRKRLSYRAWRRGFREADLILGPFADTFLASMSPTELDLFETLLDQPDQDIYDWIKGAAAPAALETELLARLRAFRPEPPDGRGA